MSIFTILNRKKYKNSKPIQIKFTKSGEYIIPSGYTSMDLIVISGGGAGCPVYSGRFLLTGGDSHNSSSSSSVRTRYRVPDGLNEYGGSGSGPSGYAYVEYDKKINIRDKIKVNIGNGGWIQKDTIPATNRNRIGGGNDSSIYINDILYKLVYGGGRSGIWYTNYDGSGYWNKKNNSYTRYIYSILYGDSLTPQMLYENGDITKPFFRTNFNLFDDPEEPIVCRRGGGSNTSSSWSPGADGAPNTGNGGDGAKVSNDNASVRGYHGNGGSGAAYLRLYQTSRRYPDKFNKQYFDENTIII